MESAARPLGAGGSRLVVWIPVAAAIVYPWSLRAFHTAVLSRGWVEAAIWLVVAFALPLGCLALAVGESVGRVWLTAAARRLAYAGLMAPPLFVLVGVVSGLVKSPVPELWTWVVAWVGAGLVGSLTRRGDAVVVDTGRVSRLRVAHGVSAAVIVLYVGFHLFNHLTGLVGPEMHARVMRLGRVVYRSRFVEPVLVGLLLFQVTSGLVMVWRGSRARVDLPRAIQLGSGAYLAAFVLTHMNSALISARMIHHIDTGWPWASGGQAGLLRDAWNIRLVPHYALGVFFVVTHLFCGLRAVMLAHDVREPVANRVWLAGMNFAAVLAAAIMAGLCGARL